jgi:prepilin-type N-terminal cleavage/methylation domain-containing protein
MAIIVHRRGGMTLVELLVVVAILGLLAVTVLPTLSATVDARQSREAARIVSSYIAKSQTRALGRTEWAGFWLTPPTSNSSADFAIDLYLADVPAVYRGDSVTTTVSGDGSPTAFVITSGSLQGASVTCAAGDLVRFNGQPPWYAFLSAYSVGLRNGGSFSENVNQNTLNTPWPADNVSHTYEILRQPIRSGSPLALADGRCVDLFWSGYGGSSLPAYSTFGHSPGSIAVLFDGTGRLRQLFSKGNRVSISGAVFLLVGRSDRAGQSAAPLSAADDSLGANWQYADSFWIAIDPLSGVAKTAECKPNATNVYDSQAFIRSEILAAGR